MPWLCGVLELEAGAMQRPEGWSGRCTRQGGGRMLLRWGRFRGLHGCGAHAPTLHGIVVVNATVPAGWRVSEHDKWLGWGTCRPASPVLTVAGRRGRGVLCGAHLRLLLRRF